MENEQLKQLAEYRKQLRLNTIQNLMNKETASPNVVNQPQTTSLQSEVQASPQKAGFVERFTETNIDLLGNVGKGLVSFLEGGYDLIPSIIGTVGGWFSDDFKNKVKEHVAYDFSDDVFSWLNEATDDSYINEMGDKGQTIVRGVHEAVGAMLPSVIAAIATSGGSTPQLVSQIASLGTMFVGAAGQSTEEAVHEGADLGKATAYGIASGAAEAALEKVGGYVPWDDIAKTGGKIFGKEVAKSALGKAAVTFASEGVEEVASDVLNPALKRITGVDNEAKIEVEQLPLTFAIGGLAGVTMGGVNRVASNLRYAKEGGSQFIEMSDELNSIQENEKKLASMQRDKKYTTQQIEDYSKRVDTDNYESLKKVSDILKSLPANKRANAFKTATDLHSIFDVNGDIKANIETNFKNNSNLNVSAGIRHQTNRLNEQLEIVNTNKGTNFELDTDALNADERKTFAKVDNAVARLAESTKYKAYAGVDIAIIKTNKTANAFIRDGVLYLSREHLTSGKWAEAVAHEITHFAEDSKEFNDFAKFLTADANAVDTAANAIAGKGYGFTADYVKDVLRKVESGEKLNARESEAYSELVAHIAEQMLGNEDSINRLVAKNKSLANRVYERIKSFIRALQGTNADKKTMQKLWKAEQLFSKALKNAGQAKAEFAKEVQKQTQKALMQTAAQFSLKTINGEKVVFIDTDQDIFDGADVKDYPKIAQKYMLDKFRGKVFPVGTSSAYVNKDSVGEYTHPANRRIDKDTRETKFKAGTELDNLLAVAEFVGHESDDGRHPDAVRGWDKYKTKFTFDGKNIFEGEISIKLIARGDLFYDLTKIKNTSAVSAVDTENSKSTSDKGVLTISNITQEKEPVKSFETKTQFSLKIGNETVNVPAQETNNLVALHNLSEENLLKVIELGGFPMPSIAVTKTDLPHENYGDITVVFGRNTIDPEEDYRNVVYDRDAWTPTTPKVEVKLSNEGIDNLIKELQEEVGKTSIYGRNISSFFDGKYRNNAGEYVIPDYDYRKDYVGDKALRNNGILAAYLKEKGISVEPVYLERGFTMGWSSFTREQASNLLDFVGITKDITRDNATEEQRKEILEKLVKYRAKEKLGLMRRFKKNSALTVEQVEEILRSEYDDGNVSQLFFMAEDFFNENRPKDQYDEYATNDKMQSVLTDKQDFYNWFWNKLNATFERKGIDNDSEVFDRRGNRRSFEQRHYDYTASNIVKAMSKGAQEGKTGWGVTAGSLAAKLSKQFESIEDIRAAKEYLALVSEEDLKAFNQKTYELYDELVSEIAGYSSDAFSDSSRREDVGEILGNCASAKPLTAENIKRIFDKETKGYNLGYKFNLDTARKTLTLFEMLQHIPTTYFEAKPRRVVKFSEIKEVLIPESASESLIKALSKKKIPYVKYSNENSRSNIINELDNIRFSRKPFAEQVDDVLNGADTTSTHLQVRETTPQIFLDIGLENKPMLITSTHTKTAVNKKVPNKNIHALSRETLKKLPELLENPAIVMDSTKEGSIVAFVNAVDEDNNPVLCAIKINGYGFYNNIRIDSNIVTSVYGKDANPIGFIEKAVDENRVLYWDKKISQDLFSIPGLQLPDNLVSLDSNVIIRKSKYVVKSFDENSSEQFSRKAKAPQETTQILTEIPKEQTNAIQKAKDAIRDTWINAQINFTDEQAGIVKEGKRLGIKNIDAETHYVRAAYNAAQYMLENEFNPIWDKVYKQGDEYRSEFYEYLMNYHNIDRVAVGKELLANTTPADSRKNIVQLETKHPEFKELAKDVWKYTKKLQQFRVEMGLITQEQADYMNAMYPHYVPTFRAEKGGQGVAGTSGKYSIKVKSTIKTAKGSTSDILPPDVFIARQTMEVFRAGRVNMLAKKLYDAAVNSKDFTNISIADIKQRWQPNRTNKQLKLDRAKANEILELMDDDYIAKEKKQNQVTFYNGAETVTMAVTPDIYAGFDSFSPNTEYRNTLLNLVTGANNVFKKLVTSANPFFLVRNFFRDLQEAGFYTKHGVKFASALGRAYKGILSNSDMWQKYLAAGGLSTGLFDYNTGVKRYKGIKAVAKTALNKLEFANMIVEQAPRFAEFMLSMESGATTQQALLDSAEVTTNFSRGGKFAKFLNRTVMPFLNPSIQGWSKLYRTVVGKKAAREWMELILKALILGIGVTALNDLLNGGDEEYESLSIRDKENYYLFKIGDSFLKIPKGRVVSVFGSLYLRGKEMAKGNENAWDGYLSSVSSAVSPIDSFTRTIFSPLSDAATNTTWYGGEIEGRRLQNLAPEDRYDEATSSIAIGLGKVFNYSPKKIHYVIDQYLGIIGDIILPLTTKKAERGILASNFTIDPTLSNRYSNDFYDALDEATYAKNAGDINSTYIAKYLNSIAGEVSDMYAQKREIENSDKSRSDKSAETKTIQALINATNKNAVANIKNLENVLNTLNVAEQNKILQSNKQYLKLDEQAQKRAIQKLNDYYYALALNKAFGTELEAKYEKYAEFNSLDLFVYLTEISSIESDKDKQGNAISGSRKTKIINYLKSKNVTGTKQEIILEILGYSINN